jgi:hypothetical protein
MWDCTRPHPAGTWNQSMPSNVWSAGILPARGTKACPPNIWSAGILPACGSESILSPT